MSCSQRRVTRYKSCHFFLLEVILILTQAAARAARDAAADARRQQNALPAWHLRSTVSGGLTALGIREQEREERERGERGEGEWSCGLG